MSGVLSCSDDEGQEDVWLKPLDARSGEEAKSYQTLIDVFIILLGVAVVMTGVSLLVFGEWTNPYDYSTPQFDGSNSLLPLFAYRYVVASMTLELACLAITGCGMCCVAATLGRYSLVHALSMFSIFNDFCLAIAYTASAMWGNLVLFRLFKMCADLSWTTPLGGLGTTYMQKALLVYAMLTALLGTSYALSRVPILLGVCDFFLHHVKRRIRGTPIVQFYDNHRRLGNEYYVQVMPVGECAALISNMQDPIHVGPSPPPDYYV